MQHRAPCPDDPADLSTAWASKLHRIPLSAPHCRFLRLFVVSDNSAQRENVPKATLARRSGFALIASSLPQSGRHVAVLAGRLLPPAPFGMRRLCPPRAGISLRAVLPMRFPNAVLGSTFSTSGKTGGGAFFAFLTRRPLIPWEDGSPR